MKNNIIYFKNPNALEDLIPPSPMRFVRCGECGCAAHGGANSSGHSTRCSRYDHKAQLKK